MEQIKCRGCDKEISPADRGSDFARWWMRGGEESRPLSPWAERCKDSMLIYFTYYIFTYLLFIYGALQKSLSSLYETAAEER